MIRNIIFDWSGTLVDDLPAVLAATNFVFEACGVKPMTLETFRAEFSLPFKGFYERFLPGVPVAELERNFHSHFQGVQNAVTELPRTREFLKFCRKHKIRTFILSTVHRDYYDLQAKALEFDQYIDKPYLGIWDKRAKILELLAENQLSAPETLFIGDMQHDIETAKFGGVHSCAVLTGYNSLDQLRASDPDLIVEHLDELKEVLERTGFDWQRRKIAAEGDAQRQPISTVGALIFDSENRVLMIRTQKWSNLWGIPGGKIKLGESSVDALRREIKEETSLDVDRIKFVMVQDCVYSREFYRKAHFVLLNYTCHVRGNPAVKLNEEAQEFRWLTPGNALELELNQPTRKLLDAVIKA